MYCEYGKWPFRDLELAGRFIWSTLSQWVIQRGDLVFHRGGSGGRELQLLRVKLHVSKPEEQKVRARYWAVTPEKK